MLKPQRKEASKADTKADAKFDDKLEAKPEAKRGRRRDDRAEGRDDQRAMVGIVAGAEEWSGPSEADVLRYADLTRRSRIYFAYQHIEDLYQPFTASHTEANFQVHSHAIH